MSITVLIALSSHVNVVSVYIRNMQYPVVRQLLMLQLELEAGAGMIPSSYFQDQPYHALSLPCEWWFSCSAVNDNPAQA